MPGTGGIEAATEVRKKWPHTRVVVLTMHAEAPYLDSALTAGASGYVLKKALDSDLVSAIRAANEGVLLLIRELRVISSRKLSAPEVLTGPMLDKFAIS
jgi:DNA-binding NarL/FixJ family response regulator